MAHEPRYQHECGSGTCVFLGQHGDADLYYCPQGKLPTVIARYSNDSSDYQSGMGGAYVVSDLGEAKRRAQAKGLIRP